MFAATKISWFRGDAVRASCGVQIDQDGEAVEDASVKTEDFDD